MLSYKQVRQHHLENVRRPAPSRGSKILVIGFALIIFLGTVLLSLPFATQGPQSLSPLDALFTSVSATTVTGLVVVNTANTFSIFGQIVILLLIQVGGVGFITLSIVLFRLIGRRVSIYERNLLRQTLGVEAGEGIVQLTLSVLLITVVIETVGAVLLFTQWVQIMDWRHAVYYAVFHSVSAFCNAGFDLFRGFDDPILQFTRNNPLILIVMSGLITIGTLGITVIYDVIVWPRERHLSLHTKIILPFTLLLIVVGTVIVIFDEALVEKNLATALPVDAPWLLAFFTVVSSRTAGITLVPMASLGEASQLIIFVWMFIGGAPASMGGGVGLSTVAVVFIALSSTARGHDDVRVLKRTLPTETIVKAIAVLTVSAAVIVTVTLALALLSEGELFTLAFEVVSAYSNTGYSLGVTDSLGRVSLILVGLTMFWGRLGPLTLVVALAQRYRKTLIRYPEEKIIIG